MAVKYSGYEHPGFQQAFFVGAFDYNREGTRLRIQQVSYVIDLSGNPMLCVRFNLNCLSRDQSGHLEGLHVGSYPDD